MGFTAKAFILVGITALIAGLVSALPFQAKGHYSDEDKGSAIDYMGLSVRKIQVPNELWEFPEAELQNVLKGIYEKAFLLENVQDWGTEEKRLFRMLRRAIRSINSEMGIRSKAPSVQRELQSLALDHALTLNFTSSLIATGSVCRGLTGTGRILSGRPLRKEASKGSEGQKKGDGGETAGLFEMISGGRQVTVTSTGACVEGLRRCNVLLRGGVEKSVCFFSDMEGFQDYVSCQDELLEGLCTA